MYSFTKVVENLVRAFPEYKHSFEFVNAVKIYPNESDIEIQGHTLSMKNSPGITTIFYGFYLVSPYGTDLDIIVEKNL